MLQSMGSQSQTRLSESTATMRVTQVYKSQLILFSDIDLAKKKKKKVKKRRSSARSRGPGTSETGDQRS